MFRKWAISIAWIAMIWGGCSLGEPECEDCCEKCLLPPQGNQEIRLSGVLAQSCPIGVVCDQSFDYHAYSGDVDSFSLYFSFKPAIVEDKSPENVLASFTYMYFRLSFPSKKTDSSEFFVSSHALFGLKNDSTEFKNEVLAYQDGKLHGRLHFRNNRITERIESRSNSCYSGDILGICYRSHDLKEPKDYVVNYQLALRE